MDAVVDVSGGEDEEELGPTIFQATMEESNKARANGPPLSYIYCSGAARTASICCHIEV